MSFEGDSATLDRLFAAIVAGDTAAVRAIYSPGVEVWHNTDGAVQTLEENLRVLGWMARNLRDLEYSDVQREPLRHERILQQHVLRGKTASGRAFAIPACAIFHFFEGRIIRVDEYLDSAQVEALRE